MYMSLSFSLSPYVYKYIYINICICMCRCLYIILHIHRENERGRDSMNIYIYICIYVYVDLCLYFCTTKQQAFFVCLLNKYTYTDYLERMHGFLMNQITLFLVKQEHMFSGWIRTRVFLFMCSSTVTLNI